MLNKLLKLDSVDGKLLLVIKIQLVLILLLLNIFLDLFVKVSLLLPQIVLSLIYLFFVFQGYKNEFKDETKNFLLLFFGLFVILQLVFAMNFFNITFVNNPYIVLGVVFLVILLFFLYSFLLNKGFVLGKIVSSDSNRAIVKISFNLTSFFPPGEYVVKTNKKFKKGQKVKIQVRKTLFGKKLDKIVD